MNSRREKDAAPSGSDAFRAAFLAIPAVSDPIPLTLSVSAAETYGRAGGGASPSVPVWRRDRDFDAIARYTGLEVAPSESM